VIRVEPTAEPATFDARCRQAGAAWLASHPRPRDNPNWRPINLWRQFLPQLRAAFHGRCAYMGMWIATGTVDHFASWAGMGREARAYEWSNYRYADATVNSGKKPAWDGQLLDPFEVDNGWFEVILPSCLLRVVEDRVPEHLLARVRFTVDKLGLDEDEGIVALRREWLRMHEEEGLSLNELHRKAPLVAMAVERRAARTTPVPQ
jgi:hypothetical protein